MDMTVRDDYVREEIMQVGGTPLRVAIRPGTATGPPLLLCNGIGMRLEAFRPFVDALDPAIEVIRFDAPGVGGSQLPNLPYRFTTLALLLREMLQNLGHQQADVLGISWGGGLAQQFALLNPRLCRRLILVATSTGPQTMVPPNPLPAVKNLILRRYGDLWGGSAKTDPDALTSALRKARISPLSIGYLYQHTAALGFTTLPLLPLIRQDRKSTRLNSSHLGISYAVFCLKTMARWRTSGVIMMQMPGLTGTMSSSRSRSALQEGVRRGEPLVIVQLVIHRDGGFFFYGGDPRQVLNLSPPGASAI